MPRLQWVRVAIAFASAAVALQAGAQHFAAPSAPKLTVIQPDLSLPLDRRMQRPAGLAWQPGGTPGGPRLWLTDSAGAVVTFDLQSPTPHSVRYTVSAGLTPAAATFDFRRGRLWAVHQPDVHGQQQAQLIRGFQVSNGGPSHLDQVLEPLSMADLPSVQRRPKINGIAVDSSRDRSRYGAIVWICRGGGLCSTIEVYDVEQRIMLAHFFPRCEPEAIAIDPDGRRLWILANNGPDRSMVLVERLLTGGYDDPSPRPSVLETRRHLELPSDIPRAVAIASTGDAIWALVKGPGSQGSPSTARVHLHRFPVGPLPVSP